MILLTSTSDKISVTTSAANTVLVHASFVDLSGTTVTPGRTNTSIAAATTTDVVASPASSTQRTVKMLSVWNDHATAAQDITVTHTDGTTAVDLWSGSVPAQSGITFDETCGWKVNGPQTPADVQTFDFPGGTWVKPTSFDPQFVLIRLWGAGGGGGAGASLATATVAKGGAGAGAGAVTSAIFPAALLPNELQVLIGRGGTGGVPGAAGAAGSNGSAGGASFVLAPVAIVGATTTYLAAAGGGFAGTGGPISTTNISGGSGASGHQTGLSNVAGRGFAGIGIEGVSTATNGPAWEGGGAGGGNNATPVAQPGGTSRWGGGGGGSGGCHDATPNIVDAQPGGSTGNVGSTASGGGGAAGTSGATPTAGGNGQDTDGISGGYGGGGGGTTVTASTSGAAGGNGGKGGGGGGGGGCGMNPGLGGRGGNGGNGYAVIITW